MVIVKSSLQKCIVVSVEQRLGHVLSVGENKTYNKDVCLGHVCRMTLSNGNNGKKDKVFSKETGELQSGKPTFYNELQHKYFLNI